MCLICLSSWVLSQLGFFFCYVNILFTLCHGITGCRNVRGSAWKAAGQGCHPGQEQNSQGHWGSFSRGHREPLWQVEARLGHRPIICWLSAAKSGQGRGELCPAWQGRAVGSCVWLSRAMAGQGCGELCPAQRGHGLSGQGCGLWCPRGRATLKGLLKMFILSRQYRGVTFCEVSY